MKYAAFYDSSGSSTDVFRRLAAQYGGSVPLGILRKRMPYVDICDEDGVNKLEPSNDLRIYPMSDDEEVRDAHVSIPGLNENVLFPGARPLRLRKKP